MRIVLVGPLYDMNVGLVCRVMKNFGFNELYIVTPRAELGNDAVKYAKHAADILAHAKIVKSFEEATRGRYPIIGTTASLTKGQRGLSRPLPLSEIADKFDTKNAALVFGREDFGLSKEDLLKCDINTYIETCDDYPSLNLSNAAAVIMYEMRRKEKQRARERIMTDEKTMRALTGYFDAIVGHVGASLRNPRKCRQAFKNIVSKSSAEDVEVKSVICVFKETLRMLGNEKRQRKRGQKEIRT